MSAAQKHTPETREQVLEAACSIFAEKGYRDATVADICARAGANIAAVNYYFHGKEMLYTEAWRRAFQRSIAKYPTTGGVPADAPPADRLRGHIRSVIARALDPDSRQFDMVHKEMANPTGLLAQVMRESIDPLRQALDALVRDLLGPDATDREVRLCAMSVMSLSMHPMMRRRRPQPPGAPPMPDPFEGMSVDEIVDHVTRFSLAGIAAARQKIADRKSGRAT